MTKYPIVLVHGIAIRDSKIIRAFGKIEKRLRNEGFTVYTANTDAFGSVESNAEQLKNAVLEIMKNTGAEKVNIIGHSKGGLDSKYMISALGIADKVASLTTICTPHKGSPVATKIWKLPLKIKKCLAFFINGFYKLIGDKNPDSLKVCEQLKSTDTVNDSPDFTDSVYCQSYSTVLKKKSDCLLMAIPMKILNDNEGYENDGIVSGDSSKFGIYKGVCIDESISHTQIIDILAKRKSRPMIYKFYIDLCIELGNIGY